MWAQSGSWKMSYELCWKQLTNECLISQEEAEFLDGMFGDNEAHWEEEHQEKKVDHHNGEKENQANNGIMYGFMTSYMG